MGAAALAIGLGAVLLTGILASVIARRSWRIPLAFALADCVLMPSGLAYTIVQLVRAFQAVAVVNPADKATLLSAGISEAMNGTAVGAMLGIPGLAVGGALLFVAFSRRARQREAATTSTRPGAPAPASAAGS